MARLNDKERIALLWELWDRLLQTLLDDLKNPPPGGLKASHLTVIAKFLKDNGVVASRLHGKFDQAEMLAALEDLRGLDLDPPFGLVGSDGEGTEQ